MIQEKFWKKFFITSLTIVGIVWSCKHPNKRLPEDYEVATAWADMTNYITKNTPANTPTFASRCFGYIGLTMYECVVNGSPEYQSVAPQLNGLCSLPLPEKGVTYNWPMVLNAGQAEILRNIYIQTSDINKNKIDSLEQDFESVLKTKTPNGAIVNRSILYGKKIAQLIFEWSKTDGGHRGYLANFDKKLIFPKRPGGWKPALYAQSFSHYPLQPHWGKNRTFLAADSVVVAPAFIPFDTVPGSAYYNQFKLVYDKRKTLSQEEKEIAIWWSDDPDVTFTPPGHSYYFAIIAIRQTKPGLVKCAETFARVGMAVSDAYVDCWKWKYQFFSERANTYVTEHIDQQWESFWPDPPFPAFPSGHAIQAAAAAFVLADLYGDNFSFSDSAHVGRPRDEIRNADFKARHYTSFWQAAEETANSRFYGGIHIPQDNQRGLEKGKEIANNIDQLHWKK